MRELSLYHFVVLPCLSVFAVSIYSAAQEKDGLLKIYFFDMGQGDSVYKGAPGRDLPTVFFRGKHHSQINLNLTSDKIKS